MNKITITLLLIICTLSLSAQEPYFVNSKGDKVDEKYAKYRRSVEKIDKSKWKKTDYYLNGALQMEGYYANRKLTIKKDTFTWYYMSGRVESKAFYINGKRDGSYESFYFNGNKNKTGSYSEGKLDGKWHEWAFDGILLSEKEYSKGEPINTWTYYDSLGVEKYKIVDANKAKVKDVYKQTSLKNGMSFEEYFSTLEYPKEVIEQNIVGYTMLEFLIDTNGHVKDVEIIIQSDKRISTAAVNHILNMPECIPSKSFGKSVETKLIIPLNFMLRDGSYEITNKEKADHFYNSAIKAAQNNDNDKAIRRLYYGSRFMPTDVESNYLLGLLFLQKNDLPNACKYFTIVYNLDKEKLEDERKYLCELK
tara:strand:- start:712 stop:1803 length:1092 start_codon:yes stop_codon:yes gene_type:complete